MNQFMFISFYCHEIFPDGFLDGMIVINPPLLAEFFVVAVLDLVCKQNHTCPGISSAIYLVDLL